MLVSAIMPTANRRKLVPLALKSFLAQHWPHKELIVIDDGADRVADLCEGLPGVHYVHTEQPPQKIGTKLNHACEIAGGDVILRFDDDDWSAPERIAEQVNRLTQTRMDVCGYNCMLFWNQIQKEASKYTNKFPFYALGTSLCFTRDYWRRNPFPAASYCEDNEFIQAASKMHRMTSVDAGQLMVARIHGSNTTGKLGPLQWPVVDTSEIPQTFFNDLGAV